MESMMKEKEQELEGIEIKGVYIIGLRITRNTERER